MNIKERAIIAAIQAMKKAISFRTKVGACLYTQDKLFPGFNIENKTHKGYHAEEVAIIKALDKQINPEDFIGIIIAYDFKDIYPACGSCRQYLWEYTNPELLITVVDIHGNIRYEAKLKELYPMPYPKERWYKERYYK